MGGGLEMCLHADLRYAASDARLGQPKVNIDFIPPVAGNKDWCACWVAPVRSGCSVAVS